MALLGVGAALLGANGGALSLAHFGSKIPGLAPLLFTAVCVDAGDPAASSSSSVFVFAPAQAAAPTDAAVPAVPTDAADAAAPAVPTDAAVPAVPTGASGCDCSAKLGGSSVVFVSKGRVLGRFK